MQEWLWLRLVGQLRGTIEASSIALTARIFVVTGDERMVIDAAMAGW